MFDDYVFNSVSEIVGKKWRLVVLYILRDCNEMRFSEIRRQLPNCSVKVLSETLKDLESRKMVIRRQYPTIPVKVTYTFNNEYQEIANLLPLIKSSFFRYMISLPEVYRGPNYFFSLRNVKM